MFKNIYKDKKVLVTGNTGFKGSWLTYWLIKLGANVIGYSKNIPTEPSLFTSLNLENKIIQYFDDIRELDSLKKVLDENRPDFIFHLAAQPIVSVSFFNPEETITTNTIGMMNICEALRTVAWPCTCILITSDKVYDNVEWVWGYKETDALGGKDIYSGSKGAAELIAKSYISSFSKEYQPTVNIAIARAGNVIGGGDWALDRLVVDCFKSWAKNETVTIRSPYATRPWQHVLEPLSGYLSLGSILSKTNKLFGEPYNFGPSSDQNQPVIQVVKDLAQHWNNKASALNLYKIANSTNFKEAGLLKLNYDKAIHDLNWHPTLQYSETISMTGSWYNTFYNINTDIEKLTSNQIKEYCKIAEERKLQWTA